ncbi:TonB-dependent receptor plug domain-containing protein, partial [Chitinimonas sp.]|uniref:TonB-dependent receptor plug domain-containing protein n=1 Tax=Chitinimonas sp. TaxID=1934313 RepID=UPI0035B47F7B
MKYSMLALALSGIGFGVAVQAADAPAASDSKVQKTQKIEVTGSNIKRTDKETVAPVTIITRAQIERSGKATIADVLRDLPINSSNGFSETSINGFAAGGSGISLRGLGGLGTLVLFNGRRVANYPFANSLSTTFVDLNEIPAAIVDRVEILKDGASALYGSDAVAGVVNVIFRRDFKGAELAYNESGEIKGDLESHRASLTFGRGDLGEDKFNVFGMVEAYKRDGVTRDNFELTKSNDYSRFFAGTDQRGSTGGTWRAATGPVAVRNNRIPVANCPTQLIPASTLNPALTGTSCVGDGGPKHTSLLPEQKRANMFVKGTFELAPELQGTVELGYDRVKTKVLQDYNYLTAGQTRFVPVVQNGETFLRPQSVRYLIAPGVGGNPTGQFAELLIPTYDLGVVTDDVDAKTSRILAGLKGSNLGWDWDSAIAHVRSTASVTESNLMSYSGLVKTGTLAPGVAHIFLDGKDSGLQGSLLPLGSNSSEVLNALRTSTTRNSEAKITTADFKASREVFSLPGGAVGLALGLDWRKEELNDTADAKLKAGDIFNRGFTGTIGSRNVSALYAELALPIIQRLDMQLALRHDRYSDFGGATSPKIGAKFKLTDSIVLRANWGKGFRAPSLPQIARSDSTAFQSYFDYAGCDAGYTPSCQGISQGTGTSVGTIIR